MQFESYPNDSFVNKTEPRLFSLKSPDCLGRLTLIKSPGIIMIEVPLTAVCLSQKILVHSPKNTFMSLAIFKTKNESRF